MTSYGIKPGKHGKEPVVPMAINGRVRCIDASIAHIVAALNAANIPTVASCSGHGHRPGNIILEDGRELFILPNYAAARKADKFWPLDINGDVVNDQS